MAADIAAYLTVALFTIGGAAALGFHFAPARKFQTELDEDQDDQPAA